MRVAFWADMLYYRIAGGTTRYSARLSAELSGMSSVDLRLLSLYPAERVTRISDQRGCGQAQSIPSRLPRQLHYLLWVLGWGRASREMVDGVDLVHMPCLAVPPHGRVPLVVTVLDLTFLLFPNHHNRRTRWMARLGLRQAQNEASAFIAISHHTAADLLRLTGISKRKVFVTPLAAEDCFRPVQDPQIRERYKLDAPYVLYVGALEPRKNLTTLVKAFAALGDREVKLVISGPKGWMYQELFASVRELGLASRVIFTGYVPDHDLPALMSAAELFVYPSVYEGFGLPVLEAMQCGAPVITANVSSLPEVAGDAALLVAPHDVCGLAAALRRVLSEPGLREEMRGRGLERAQSFSWRKTAELTVEAYREVCH